MRGVSGADVAVYSPFAAPFYAESGGTTGGAELQSYHLARALAGAGLRVRHVIAPEERLHVPKDGVELVSLGPGYGAGRLARRRAIVSALQAADARVFVQRSAGFETGMVGAFARAKRRRFVFSSSSTADFACDLEIARQAGTSLDHWPSRLQYRLGLRCASTIVVQTNEQRELARTKLGIETDVIPSFAEVVELDPRAREAFLWVGAFIEIKDPLAYVELARRVPEARFWMLAIDRGELWRELVARVTDEAARLPNLELLTTRPREEVLSLYARSIALVNTSRVEGFPNTFLEAWACGTPALSLRVDPDGTIMNNGLGTVAGGSMERLAEAARTRWARRDAPQDEAVRAYVRRTHHPQVVGRQWVDLIRRLLDG